MALPETVVTRLVRGVGAYVRATHETHLPASLKPLKKISSDKMLVKRKQAILKALEDDVVRGLLKEWLAEDKPKLPADVASALHLAVDRPDGWEERLAGDGKPVRKTAPKDPVAELQRRFDAEKDKVKRAKEAERTAKEAARAAVATERARIAELRRALQETERALRESATEARRATADADKTKAAAERVERKARSEMAKAQEARDEAKKEAREARKELTAMQKELRALRAEVQRLSKVGSTVTRSPVPERKGPAKKRKPLPVPKGRFDDDPMTLDHWLEADLVHLLVDGYNVTKAKQGFKDLDLDKQRERLIEGVKNLAHRRKVKVTVVFDGADVGSAPSRKPHRLVAIDYSAPGQIGDDRLIEILEKLPQHPVIVATNDKELQQRSRRLGATIATSDQLLRLIR